MKVLRVLFFLVLGLSRGIAASDTDTAARAVEISNGRLSVSVDKGTAAFTVTDQRSRHSWKQMPLGREIVCLGGTTNDAGITLQLKHSPSGSTFQAVIHMEPAAAEFTVEISGRGKLPTRIQFPLPFVTDPGTEIILPLNEGIAYPIDDATIATTSLSGYGGHGLCMSFVGATNGREGYMAIIETPDDFRLEMRRANQLLCLAPEWEAQKSEWGYTRKLRYIFFEDGGYVAMCKRYRKYVQAAGRLRTLAEKRAVNPNVDRLIGAVNIWCWDRDPDRLAAELEDAGIKRILWSNKADPAQLRAMNERGVLTSRYDIYQDVMDPAKFPLLKGVHPDWPTAAWPHDLITDASGKLIPGWKVLAKDGEMIPCGVLCDRQALQYADERLSAELKDHPYLCRFIDTTTASNWRECYSPDHPMTRSDSREWRMKLLELVSNKYHLVTGSETGHDAAVPFVDYFEGMMSLAPYRVPDSGRNMQKILDEVPDNVAKFQVGERYRLPLWELVYHDCVAAQWYWGDYNNKLPAIWAKRDLFNILYGTAPMFMFDRKLWEADKARFVKSYQAITAVTRAAGYSEMTDHAFLSDDRSVQQTVFANHLRVIVNFGTNPFKTKTGEEIPAGGYRVVTDDRT